MSKKSFIDQIDVKTPCTEDWSAMKGNARVRFCSHCANDVTDLSAVTRKEAMRLVRASDGKLCVRYLNDPVTKRPVFADQMVQIGRRAPGLAAGVITATIALSASAYSQGSLKPSPTPATVAAPGTPVTNDDGNKPAADQITSREVITLPPTTERFVTMGMVALPSSQRYKTPLVVAVQNEDVEEVRALIVGGADVNGRDRDKITPLFEAVEIGNLEITEMLLRFGAKVNIRDSRGQTPLMRIDDEASPEMIELLVRHGAKLNLMDSENNNALILAAGRVSPEVLKSLIVAGADVNMANKDGQTALMNAAENDLLENVRLLLEANAKVNMKNSDGDTAWDLAADAEVEKLLVIYGAEVKGLSDDENAPIID